MAWENLRRIAFTMTHVWDSDKAEDIIAAHEGLEGPMLPILHGMQEAFGYIPEAVVRLIAARLNLSRAEVYGVVSFYHDFRREPAGRHLSLIHI